ncbi:carboxypeptidase regulatory-like domain-containing protein [Spirosoma sp. BT702]|uniref:Carboxypeptidase regulatory-like domain-containing protein n=1 Tax=Spirosoma profusum TaxID=2771354 RepID=A0A926XSZ4_9BACT|nr:carboxypeptidase-like regulatory domain-containing protein [Spirosoma profusum]MBD2699548.1 carboxypeptidase regulatory-like domain-containing protein [Spirosoma profusum]
MIIFYDMKVYFLLLIFLIFGLTGCKKPGGTDTIEPQKGYISGIVMDTKGQPIQDALVYISSTGPYANGASVHTDAKGNYRVKMDYGSYRAYATFQKSYAGVVYDIQLMPSNSDSFSESDSPIVDFKWVLSGKKPIPLQGYFGGYIGLYQGDTNIPKNEVEFTFTALELIDGTTLSGPILKKPTEVSTQYLEDLPLGKYKVTAIHKPTRGTAKVIALKNKDTGELSSAGGSINVVFKPESSGFYRANIEFFEP